MRVLDTLVRRESLKIWSLGSCGRSSLRGSKELRYGLLSGFACHRGFVRLVGPARIALGERHASIRAQMRERQAGLC